MPVAPRRTERQLVVTCKAPAGEPTKVQVEFEAPRLDGRAGTGTLVSGDVAPRVWVSDGTTMHIEKTAP